MKEILQELLAAEGKARETLSRAEEETSKIIEDASRQAQEEVDSARKRGREEAERLVRSAVSAASSEREREIEQFAETLARGNYGSREAKERAVEEVFRAFTGS